VWIYIKLAWRNVLRNKRRTFIAGTAIGIGLAALIFVDALVIGMENNMVESATASFLGEGQIHREGFRKTQEVEKTINELDWVMSKLKTEEIVQHFTPRTLSFAMITSAANVSSINLVGIQPSTEQYLSQVDEAIIEGNYFDNENERSLVLGSKLAQMLEVGIGGRVVLTVSQSETGQLSQDMFRVTGIYRFNVREMDRGMAFVRLEKAQDMLDLGKSIHEIAIKFTDTGYGRDKALPFWNKYSKHGNKAIGWTEILPQLEAAFEMSQLSTYITGAILFGVVAFGIINTLFMSLHERMFEFGVLRAVGTRPIRMGLLILFEACFLAILSIVIGAVIGFVITYITTKTGIDYRGIEFMGVTMRELLYPVLNLKQFTFYPFWVFVFTVLTGIYPAVHAARMLPAEAMRKSF
jgi:ABC-type lipoprotein release transport system permease subunit